MTRVLLAEDHAVVREGLRALLESTDRMEVVGEAGTGREAVTMAQALNPDIVVLDIGMPDMDGISAARQIRKMVPGTGIVVLTMYSAQRYVEQALSAGVFGYVLKEGAAGELLTAIDAVGRGDAYLSPSITRMVLERHRALLSGAGAGEEQSAISEREREVLKLIADGKSNKAVAELLHLSEKTVATHRSNLMRKLDLHNVSELVRYAVREGMVEVE